MEQELRVCLIDGNAARTLFLGEDPIGQTVYLEGFSYTVVGMIDEDENASLFSQILQGGETDGTVYVPYTAGQEADGHGDREHAGGLCDRLQRHRRGH